jgi:AcrR family transcriptional regulator
VTVSSAVKQARGYDSTRRRAQAAETQAAILRAAHDLFVARGYGRTTIAEVARTAGVSAETVYAGFGSKVNLLHRVWDVTIGGDDREVAYHERPEVLAVRAEPDLARRLAMQAALLTHTAPRVVPFLLAMQSAAAVEPAAAAMVDEIGRQRFAGMGVMAREAAATGQLAVTEEECRDLIWATTDGMLWHRLVQQRNWSDEEFARWLEAMWIATLVRHRE